MFSLSKESDQDFINFMRGVKTKMKKKIEKNILEFSSKYEGEYDYSANDFTDEY